MGETHIALRNGGDLRTGSSKIYLCPLSAALKIIVSRLFPEIKGHEKYENKGFLSAFYALSRNYLTKNLNLTFHSKLISKHFLVHIEPKPYSNSRWAVNFSN